MPVMDHISFSSLSMFLKCGEQFRRRYECNEIIPPSASLARGTCGHKSLEANFRQKIETREDLFVPEDPDQLYCTEICDSTDRKIDEAEARREERA